MQSISPRFPTGGVTFTFTGGPRNGQSVRATAPATDGEMSHAHGLWVVTDGGTVGRRFPQSDPAYWDDHSRGPHFRKYEVVSKAEHLTGVVVECVYLGA